MKSLNNKSITLVAAIAIMLLMAILGLSLVSILGVTSRGVVDYQRSSQAFALAQAGLNWYMMQLAGISDWNTATDQAGISLNPGAFDVTLTNKASPQTDSITPTRMDINVTGKVVGSDAVTVQRSMSQRVWKLPSASKFAVYWGRNTGAWLELRSNTVINGDLWSRGTTDVKSGSSINNGISYRPNDQDIVGAGVYVEQSITSPYPAMPAINPIYYTDLISTYNGMITGSGTVNQNTNLVLAGDIITCRDFNTNTIAGSNVTISGYGYIIASRNMALNSAGGSGRSLSIAPSGGNIVFIAQRNFTIGSPSGGNIITISSGARIYARANNNADLLAINNNNTNIDGALIFGNRCIIVRNSANLTSCTLFLNRVSDDTNNFLQIKDAGTSVGVISGPCSIMSISRIDPGLIINNNAAVVGLVYHNDTANTGYTQINTATITGSVVANQYTNDRIVASSITYDPNALPDPPPEGFDGFVTKKPDSWSGN